MLGFGLVWKVPSGQVQVQGCYPCLLSDIKESRVATKIFVWLLKESQRLLYNTYKFDRTFDGILQCMSWFSEPSIV